MNVTTATSGRRNSKWYVYNRFREQHRRREVRVSGENQAFATEKELAKLSADWQGSRLVEIWNSFAGIAPFSELTPVQVASRRHFASHQGDFIVSQTASVT